MESNLGYWQKHKREKSRKKSNYGEKNYVNQESFTPYFLTKKHPVENAVENVENSVQPTENPFSRVTDKKNLSNFLVKNRTGVVTVITCYGNKKCQSVPVVF